MSIKLFLCFLFFTFIELTTGHGRLMEPPARNTMWRFGFPSQPNYEDSELFCGGIKVQWQDNQGKCGLCGDSYSGPRRHETGGSRVLTNVTTRTYPPATWIDVVVEIVTNHQGKFNFQMCWRQSPTVKETEDCFEPLQLKDGSQFHTLRGRDGNGFFVIPVQLPANRTCESCILRWQWISGNNWGQCDDGVSRVGCGPQETYRNCADIKIRNELGIRGSHLISDTKRLGESYYT